MGAFRRGEGVLCSCLLCAFYGSLLHPYPGAHPRHALRRVNQLSLRVMRHGYTFGGSHD